MVKEGDGKNAPKDGRTLMQEALSSEVAVRVQELITRLGVVIVRNF